VTEKLSRPEKTLAGAIQGENMSYFHQLGSLVDRLWKEKHHDERAFPQVAMSALAELPPSSHVSFRDAVLFGLTDPLPAQSDLAAEFGQPPLTVYSAEGFRIEVLFWLHVLPSIHQHGFSGAFHVMHGTTLHATWQFDQKERITAGLLTGKLRLTEVELLRQGDTRPIFSGKELIHATYHLQQPTVSVVVRTVKEFDRLPQYSYFPPTIAIDPDESRPCVVRRCQILTMLLNLGKRGEFLDAIQHLMATSDPSAAFQYLLQANTAVKDPNLLHEILAAARVKHARLVEEAEPALAYLRRQARLENMKSRITDPDLQFFLGVLLSVPDRELALAALRQQYPSGDPVALFTGLTNRLSNLGLLGFRFNDTWSFMLTCLMRDISSSCEIQRQFAGRYGEIAAQNNAAGIVEMTRMLTGFWMFAPYFQPFHAEGAERSASRGAASSAGLPWLRDKQADSLPAGLP